MNRIKTLISKACAVYMGAFLLVFSYGLMASAQEGAPDAELEDTLNMTVNAFKVGQVGGIIMALVMLLRTRFVTGIILAICARVGVQAAKKPDEPGVILEKEGYTQLEVNGAPVDSNSVKAEQGVTVEPKKLSGAATTSANILLGAGAGIAQSLATGQPMKQAVLTGLLSSGVATALWEIVAKPLVKKLTK